MGVPGNRQVDAVILGIIRRQVAILPGKGFGQVQVIEPALLAHFFDFIVHAAHALGGQAGGLVQCFGPHVQNGLHKDHAVGQRALQFIQQFAVIRQKAFIIAQSRQCVGADQQVQLGGLLLGQDIQRNLLGIVLVGVFQCGAVHDLVGAGAFIPQHQRTTHVNVIIRNACGQRIAQKCRIGKPIGAHPAKLRHHVGGLRVGGVSIGFGLLHRANGSPVNAWAAVAGAIAVGIGHGGHQPPGLGGLLCANRHIFHSFVAWQQQGNHPGQQQNARRCARKDHPPVRQARFAT